MKILSQICLAFMFLGGFTQSALAMKPFPKPPLPQIKDIPYSVFVNASEDKQIKALQIEANYKEKIRKATQKYRDEREKLELEKSILQVKFYNAKIENNQPQSQDLIIKIHGYEQELLYNRQDEKNLHDKLNTQRIQEIYNTLRSK